MGPRLKYIIYEDYRGLEISVLFSRLVDHSAMWQRLARPGCTLLGAGFVSINVDEFNCYGESVSLRIKSRGEEDTRVLNRAYNL